MGFCGAEECGEGAKDVGADGFLLKRADQGGCRQLGGADREVIGPEQGPSLAKSGLGGGGQLGPGCKVAPVSSRSFFWAIFNGSRSSGVSPAALACFRASPNSLYSMILCWVLAG